MTRDVLLVKPFTQLCMKDLRVSLSAEAVTPLFSLKVVAHWKVTVPILSTLAELSAFCHANVRDYAKPRVALIPR